MQLRILNFHTDFANNVIYLGDDNGNVRKIDTDLNLIDVSPSPLHSRGQFKITGNQTNLFTRDYYGNIAKWDKETLTPQKFIVSSNYTNAENNAQPVPSPSNAVVAYENKLYAANANGEICVFDSESMQLEQILMIAKDVICDSINLEMFPTIYASDMLGGLHKYNAVTGQTEKSVETRGGIAHMVVVDKKHNRLWQTSDSLCGFSIADLDCNITKRYPFTQDDVEEIHFNSDYSRAYICCFDHRIHVFQNDEEPVKLFEIGPFKYQVTHMKLDPNEEFVYFVLESGEFIKYDLAEQKIVKSLYGTDAVWAMEPLNDSSFLCAHENGYASIYEVKTGKYNLPELFKVRSSARFDFARFKRVQPVTDERFLAATSSGHVALLDFQGKVHWQYEVGNFLRDVVLHRDGKKCLAASENGRVVELNVETGELLHQFEAKRPIYSVCYCQDFILACERLQFDAESSVALPYINILSIQDLSLIERKEFHGNIKRLHLIGDDYVLAVGSAKNYATLYSQATLEPVKTYSDWLLNTPENAAMSGSTVYVVTYNQQLNVYDRETGELLDSQFTPESLPKSVRVVNERSLLVSGRGFISLYDISNRVPQLISTEYLGY